MNQAQGINFVELEPNKHLVGIKREQFIEYLNSLPADRNGWVNFKLNIFDEKYKGFSAQMNFMTPKDVYETRKNEGR